MLEQDFFNGSRIDVVAAADHEILGAASDPEKTVLVEPAKITGIDPIASDERVLVVQLVEVTVEDSRSGHDHDANLVYRAIALEPTVVVELYDTNASIGHRQADGPEAN